MYWNDGSVYLGYWRGGQQEGEGILRMPNGRIKQGVFHENKLIEACKVTLPEPFNKEVNIFSGQQSP